MSRKGSLQNGNSTHAQQPLHRAAQDDLAPDFGANPHTSNGGSYFCSMKREDIDIYHLAGILSAGDWLRTMPFRNPSKTAAEIDSMWIWKFPIKAFHPKRYIFSRNSGRRIATIHKRGTASKVQVHRDLWFDKYYMFHEIPTSLCLFLKMEKSSWNEFNLSCTKKHAYFGLSSCRLWNRLSVE